MNRFSTSLPIFDRVVNKIAQLPLLHVLVVVVMAGALLFGRGIYLEQAGQRDLRWQAGENAVIEYRSHLASQNVMSLNYLSRGVRGELAPYGANAQATGMVISYGGSLLALLTVLSARACWKIRVRRSPVAGRKKK